MEQIIAPIKGMWRDSSPASQPENTVRKIKNGLYVKKYDAIRNEDGFEEENITVAGEQICGVVAGKGLRFFMIKDSVNDKIYKKEKGKPLQLITQGDFGFNEEFIVTGLVTANAINQILLILIQDNQPMRIINTSIDNSNKSVNEFNIFPDFNTPNVLFEEIEQGGTLDSGAYYCFIQYANFDNTTTKWVNIGKPIFIVSSYKRDFPKYKGNFPSMPTTKQIQINLTNVDTDFDLVNFAFIRKIDGVVEGVFGGRQNINSSNITFVYGGNNLGSVSVEELITNDGAYSGAETVISLNKQLLFAGVKKEREDNFLEESLKIKIKGVSKLVDVTQPSGSAKLFDYNSNNRTFSHGEVYAFFSRPVFRSGAKGRLYHIRGNLAGVSAVGGIGTFRDDAVIGLNVGNVVDVNGNFVSYQPNSNTDTLYDDAILKDTVKLYQTRDTTKNWTSVNADTKTFDLGFWENEDEVYSSRYGSIAGENINHFRFPTTQKSWVEWTTNTDNSDFGATKMDILGIEVDLSAIDVSNLPSDIVGIEIFFAKRDSNNITQLGQSALCFNGRTSAYTFDTNGQGALGGIYASQSFNGGANGEGLGIKAGNLPPHIRFHAFDMLQGNPNVVPSFIRQEFAIQTIANYSKDNIRFVSNPDFTKGFSRSTNPDTHIKKINRFELMPANSSNSIFNNTFGETAYFAELDNCNNSFYHASTRYTIAKSENTTNWINQDIPNGNGTDPVTTYLSTLNVLRTNVYLNFESIFNFVSTGVVFKLGDFGLGTYIFGGDTFACEHSFFCYGRRGITTAGVNNDVIPNEGMKVAIRCIVNSTANAEFRATGQTQYEWIPYKDEWPNTGALSISELSREIDPNQAPYDTAYSSINDLQSGLSYNFNLATEFPHRILRFAENSEFALEGNLKEYRPLDYYDIDRIFGKIIALKSNKDRIYIVTETTTLLTIGQETFTTDSGVTALTGNNDIFRVPPKVLVDEETGRVGSRHKLSCLSTAMGLVLIDEEQRKIYLIGESPTPISDLGFRTEFYERLPFHYSSNLFNLITTNPLCPHGVGYTVANDITPNNRLLISKKDYLLLAGLENVQIVSTLEEGINLPIGTYWYLNNKIYKVLNPTEQASGKYGQFGFIPFSNTDEYENKSFTFSFSFDTKHWVSEHEYLPDYYINDRANVWSIKGSYLPLPPLTFIQDIYWHNRTKHSVLNTPIPKGQFYFSEQYNFHISLVFAQYAAVLKWFYHINWFTEAKTETGKLYMFDTFNYLFAYNQYQATEKILLINNTNSYFIDNIKFIKNIWNFNSLSDAVINKVNPFVINTDEPITSNLAPRPLGSRDNLIDHYLVVCLEYVNKIIDNEPIELYLYNAQANFNAPIKR